MLYAKGLSFPDCAMSSQPYRKRLETLAPSTRSCEKRFRICQWAISTLPVRWEWLIHSVMVGQPKSRTARFTRRRAEILDVASAQINLYGASGLTLTAVARELGLDTSSVTYYFRLKDDLAAACLGRTIDHLHEIADAAAQKTSLRERVETFVALTVEVYRSQRHPATETLATLSDLSSLEEAASRPVIEAYEALFMKVRALFEPVDPPLSRSISLIAANIILANILWMGAWVDQYQSGDLSRVRDRLVDLFSKGLAPEAPWSVNVETLKVTDGPADAQTRFLHAATNLINRIGYKGASVEKIASELGVSVGSFYHHLDGKDDLVVACFERSFRIMEDAQARAEAAHVSPGRRLGALTNLLLAFQFAAESPLLRTSAYQTLPLDLRAKMFDRTRALTLHISGLMADAIAERTLRPVDPLIASQVFIAAIHAAADMRAWAARRPLDKAVAAYSLALQRGLGV